MKVKMSYTDGGREYVAFGGKVDKVLEMFRILQDVRDVRGNHVYTVTITEDGEYETVLSYHNDNLQIQRIV